MEAFGLDLQVVFDKVLLSSGITNDPDTDTIGFPINNDVAPIKIFRFKRGSFAKHGF